MEQKSWFIPRPSLSSSSSSTAARNNQNNFYQNEKEENSCKDSIHEACDTINCDIKRGSHSSQGSSDSEQSIRSTTSLLLTVKNLENFAKIQNYQQTPYAFNDIERNECYTHPNNFHHSILAKKFTKEHDQMSMASSTHFTMVNGFESTNNNRKSSFICKRSKQVSVLIITMSLLFLIGISTAVLLIELRNREMPR